MKRYAYTMHYGNLECETGDWVLYSEAQAEIERLREEVQKYKDSYDTLLKNKIAMSI